MLLLTLSDPGFLACSSTAGGGGGKGADSATLNITPLKPSTEMKLGKQLVTLKTIKLGKKSGNNSLYNLQMRGYHHPQN